MRFRFIHAADIHLGYEQYNLAKRADDFTRAYVAMVDHAVTVGADFVLIAGDLFHKANTDAWTLKQATYGLQKLKDAGIPVVAIEGNHDVQHHHKNLSWMEFLCDQDLLTLLNVENNRGLFTAVPFDNEIGRGTWVDVAGARIYGVKYYGAATARALEQIAGDVEATPYTILAVHAGMEGQVPHMHGGLTRPQVHVLRPQVDYLALGHVHKRLEEADWIFNPGSTEINSIEEMDWPHGFFDVTVDTDADPKHTVVPVPTPGLRPFRRISVTADDAGSVDDFVARVEEAIAGANDIPESAVVELSLGGVAHFRRQDVPLERLKSMAQSAFNPLVVRIRNALIPPGIVRNTSRERLTRAELERQIVEHLVYQNAEHRDRASAWARLILEVKRMAVEGDIPANIADHVARQLSVVSSQLSVDSSDSPADSEATESHVDDLADANGDQPFPLLTELITDN
jgi:DNA repair exonuclease SbcCD nuclease subunit